MAENVHDSRPLVLHVRSSGGLFGAERVVLDLCETLPSFGYRCLLVPLIESDGSGTVLMEAAEARGIRVSPLHLRSPWDISALFSLRKIARETGAAILHGHDYKSNAALWMAGSKAPRLATLHGRVGISPGLRIKESLDRFALNGFNRVICVSEGQATLERRRGIRNITVVRNGIDPKPFRQKSDLPFSDVREFKKSLGIDPAELVVGAIGRLGEEKGYDLLLRACARLNRGEINFKILLVGEGPQAEALRELANSLGIGDKLLLPGFRNDPASFYPVLDVFCMPSHREGLPLALLEAMAAGRAVIANTVGGIPEVLGGNGVCGLLLSDNEEQWVAALEDLLRNPARRMELGDAAAKRVESSFSREGTARDLAYVYKSLLND